MARPIKNNADYFPHDADMRNDPRIKALRRKFGIEGYGVYSMLLEFLTDSDYFEFKNDSLSMELVAGDFDIETDKLCEILRYCFQLDLFQLDAETNVISCKSLDKRLEPLLSKRKRDRNEVIGSDNTQSKVKESKEKESILYDLQSNPLGFYILITDSTKQTLKIHQQSFEKFMQGTFGPSWEGQVIALRNNPPPIELFFKLRNGETFNSNQHVWQSFKKLWLNPPSTTTNGKPKSKIH